MSNDTINHKVLNQANRLANRAQQMLHRPNVSQSTYDKADEMLRQARNLTARAHSMSERF